MKAVCVQSPDMDRAHKAGVSSAPRTRGDLPRPFRPGRPTRGSSFGTHATLVRLAESVAWRDRVLDKERMRLRGAQPSALG